MKRWWIATLGAVLLVSAPAYFPPFYFYVLRETLIYGLFAMSLDLLLGYTGLWAFGQAGIFGTAAYVVGYLTTRAGLPMALTFVIGVLAATMVSLIFGALAIRTSEVYFGLITLAEGMVVWGLAYRWTSVTGGENGIRGIGRSGLVASDQAYYWLVLAIVAVSALLMYRFVHSPFGLSLEGLRESASRMRTVGYTVWLHRLIGFVVAGFFSGVAGVLYVFHNGFVSPTAVHVTPSIEGILMVILGGTGTLFGPLLGAGGIVFIRNIVSQYTARWMMVMGGVFMLIVLLAPQGIVGIARRLAGADACAAEPRQERSEGGSGRFGKWMKVARVSASRWRW